MIKFWLDNAGRYPLLTKDQVLNLARTIQTNAKECPARNRAVTKLVRHNLRLIPKIVMRAMKGSYGKSYRNSATEDLLQAGVIGLTRAAELFDPTRGYAFSTYAATWIFQSVQRDIYNNTSTIRVPESTLREYYDFRANLNNPKKTPVTDPKKLNRYRDAEAAILCCHFGDSGKIDTFRDPGYQREILEDTVDDLIDISGCNDFERELATKYFKSDVTIPDLADQYHLLPESVKRITEKCVSAIRTNLLMV